MWTRTVVALALIGLACAAIPKARTSRIKREANFKTILGEIIDVLEPLETYPEMKDAFGIWRKTHSVISDSMTLEEINQHANAVLYSYISGMIGEKTAFPDVKLTDLIKMVELDKYVGSDVDIFRVAGAVQPFLTSAMTYEQAYSFMGTLQTVIFEEASKMKPEMLLTAFKAGIDKVESLGEINPFLTTFIKRARNIYDGITDPTVKDIFMEVIVVQMHGMIMNEFLPAVGARDINITAEIEKLGVKDYIGEISQLDDMIAKVQPLLAKNMTFNETIGVAMQIFGGLESGFAKDNMDFEAMKQLAQNLMNKTEMFIPDPLKEDEKFSAFMSMAKSMSGNLTSIASMAMANQVYNYVMKHVFPMAKMDTVDVSAIMDMYKVGDHVKGVISLDEMTAKLQPFLKGNMTMEQGMEVFKQLYQLIEKDATSVNANTMQVMAENILNQYGDMIPDASAQPEMLRNYLNRMHHMYNNLPEGEMKSFFTTIMTNTVFERLTQMKLTNAPGDIKNMFNKDEISQMFGVNIDTLAAVLRPMFDGKVDLEQMPYVMINAMQLFMGVNTDFELVTEIFRRAMPKIKNVMPNPINNNEAYKQLLSMVEHAKKSMSKEEGDFLTAIFGELGGDASSLFDAELVKQVLGQSFDIATLTSLIQPILDGTTPMQNIPGIFVTIYDMFKSSEKGVDLQELGFVFAKVLDKLKILLPDPLADSVRYNEFMRYVAAAKAGVDENGQMFLSEILGGSMDDAMKDLGLGSKDLSGIMDQIDEGSLQVMGEMKKFTNVLNMDDFSEDDFLAVVDMASDVGTEVFSKVMGLASGSTSMNAAELADVPPELFGAMGASSLKTMASSFDEDQKDSFCSNLIETDGSTAGELMGAVDCGDSFKRLQDSGAIVLDKDYEATYVESLKSGKAVDQWSENDWDKAMDFAGGMAAEDFGKMPPAVMLKNMDKLVSQKSNMDEESMDEMFESLGSAYGGDFSQMDGATLGKLGSFIDEMPLEDLEKIPPEQKLAALSGLKGMEMDDAVAAEFADDILEAMPSPDTWTAENLENVVDFIKYDDAVVDQIPIETLAAGMSAIAGSDFDDTEAATFADRFMEDTKYKEPTNWDTTMLTNAAPLMSALPPSFIDGLDATKLMSAMTSSDKFSKVDFPKTSGRKILEKIKGQLADIATGLTPDVIKKMGKMIKSFQSDEILQISPANMKASLKHFRDIYDDMEYSTRRNIVNKLKELPGGLGEMLNDLGEFFEDLTMDEIDALPYDLIEPKKISPKDAFTARPTPGQARRLYDNVKNRFGSPDSAAGNWTMNFWKFLGRGVCGMPCSDINKIPLSKKVPDVFKLYADMEDCLGDGQLRCMTARLKTLVWNTTSDQPLHSQITRSGIAYYGRFVPFMNVTDLEKFNKTLCGDIVRASGKYPLDNMPRSNLIQLKDFSLACAGKLTSGTILKEELRMAGDIVCGIEVEDLDRFDAKLFKNHFRDFSERCDFPADVEQKLLSRGLQMMGLSPKNMTVKDLVRLGPAVLHMSEADLNDINDNVLFKGSARLIKGFKKKVKKMAKRQLMGMPVSDNSEAQDRFNKRMISVFVTKRNAKKTNRRRRAATQSSALTCADLKKIGSGVTSLTLAELDIATGQFSSCADFLGGQTGWSANQKTQLAETAKLAWGSPDSWSTATLVSAGSIAMGLTDGELATLKITSIDAISGMGKYSGWTSTQLSTVFSVWLSGTQSGLATNIDLSELSSIGEFVCGASASQIETIPVASYKGAATKVGEMTSCDATQLAAYANLAKNAAAFGAASTWDAATMATVGNVIGGLSSSDISSLTQTQIEALSTTSITKIPVSSFTALSVTQLGYFSSSQANSVTANQMNALSDAQKAALSGAGAITTTFVNTNTNGNNPSNGAGFVTSGLFLNFLLVVIPFLFC